MGQESSSVKVDMSGPPRRLKREIQQFGRRWVAVGWITGVVYGYLVWGRGWPSLWTLLGAAILYVIIMGTIDFTSTETVKRWIAEEAENLNMKR